MNRSVTRVGRMGDENSYDFVPGSPESRLSLVWPFTREAASLSKYHDVYKDYKDILQSLVEENVKFLLVGAYALAAHTGYSESFSKGREYPRSPA